MTNYEHFLSEIQKILTDKNENIAGVLSPEAYSYWVELQNSKTSTGFTETGEKILRYMLETEQKYSNSFCAKTISEGLFIPTRSVTGSMRKLVNEGYVEKIAEKPVAYAVTEKARTWQN